MTAPGLHRGWIGLIIAAIELTGCGRLPALSASPGPPAEAETITVTGYGEARGDPDVLTVEVGVNVSDKDITQAVSSAIATIERITLALAQFGIAETDVQTTGFNVWSEDVCSPTTGGTTGEKNYRVDSSLRVTVREVDRAGEVLQEAIKSGANNIYGMNFSLMDPEPLASQARAAAIEDARRKAAQLAQEFGVTLGQVRRASEVSGGPIPVYTSMAYGIGGGGDVPVSPGQLTVGISVEATYDITR